MPAGFGGGGMLPAGKYVAQVVEVKIATVDDFNDRSKKVRKFQWVVDVKVGDGWERQSIFTGMSFADMTRTKPQFVPTLNKIVRACGVTVPQSAADAAAWQEDDMVGKQFGIHVVQDEETGELVRKYVPLNGAAEPERVPVGAGAGAADPKWAE